MGMQEREDEVPVERPLNVHRDAPVKIVVFAVQNQGLSVIVQRPGNQVNCVRHGRDRNKCWSCARAQIARDG